VTVTGGRDDPGVALVRLVDPQPWKQHAACRGLDPELFFPERGDPQAPARRVCRGCPVRVPCLEYALDTRQVIGIWGGTSERCRRQLRAQRRRSA
jgi:WhiB family redox-sensing transcriptional regulator